MAGPPLLHRPGVETCPARPATNRARRLPQIVSGVHLQLNTPPQVDPVVSGRAAVILSPASRFCIQTCKGEGGRSTRLGICMYIAYARLTTHPRPKCECALPAASRAERVPTPLPSSPTCARCPIPADLLRFHPSLPLSSPFPISIIVPPNGLDPGHCLLLPYRVPRTRMYTHMYVG